MFDKFFEIFRVGKHTDSRGNEREWKEADLDKMADSYDPKKHEAPIVVGHPKDNHPAFGWIDGLKREGDVLLAKAKDVVSDFEDMVKAGMFKKRSISVYPDGSLRHVGFLGAAPPAVKGLKDLEFKDEEEITEVELENEIPEVEANPEESEEDAKGKLKELEKDFNEEKKRRIEAEAKMAEMERNIKKAEIKNFVESRMKEGRLIPAQAELFTKIMENAGENVIEFNEKMTSVYGLVKELANKMPIQVTMEEIAKKSQSEESGEFSEYGSYNVDGERLELHKKAVKRMKAEGCGYKEAIKREIENQ